MDEPEMITLSEVSQTKRQISYDTMYMWNLKKNVCTTQIVNQCLEGEA